MTDSPRFQEGTRVRAVRGPSGAMQAERQFIGRVGTVFAVNQHADMPTDYTVDFDSGSPVPNFDLVDETCLEAV